MYIKSLLFGIFMIGFALTATAQTATPAVSGKQISQQQRIGDGVKDGELTRKETKALEKQQARVNRSKKRAKADGVVTGEEKARLRKQQKRSSANIYRKKHNAKERN